MRVSIKPQGWEEGKLTERMEEMWRSISIKKKKQKRKKEEEEE